MFVPLDTMQYTRFHRQLSAKSIIITANLRYIDRNRKELKKQYQTFEDFKKGFEVPKSLIDEMLAEAEKQKIKPVDDAELQRTLPRLKSQLKALVARDLWDMSEYFAIINEDSDIVNKAISLLGNKE